MAGDGKSGLTDSVVVEAGADKVMDVLLDFDSYTEWMNNLLEIEVLERDDQGRGIKIRYKLDVTLTKVNYVLRFSYPESNRIDITFVEGDLEDCNSYYIIEPLEDGNTEVTYHYDIEYSIPRALKLAAKKMIKQIDKKVMNSALYDLKARAESL